MTRKAYSAEKTKDLGDETCNKSLNRKYVLVKKQTYRRLNERSLSREDKEPWL